MASTGQEVLPKRPHWCSTGNDENLPTYRHFTKWETNGNYEPVRLEYIQRPTDKSPILFYKHCRDIDFALGNQNCLILINDSEAVDDNQVVIYDLKKRKKYRIDQEVLTQYQKIFPNNGSFSGFIFATALAFSPNDKQVFIRLEMDNQSVQNKVWYRKHPQWSYVVDSANGKILKIYKTEENIPINWWVSN